MFEKNQSKALKYFQIDAQVDDEDSQEDEDQERKEEGQPQQEG